MWRRRRSMPNVLLEIGLEEVPARFVEQCLNDIKAGLLKRIKQHRLDTETTQILSFGTYRRFSFIISNVLDKQPDISEQLEGPPLRIARSDDGQWLEPAKGFAKKCNVDLSQLVELENKKGQPVVSAHFHKKGQPSEQLFPEIFSQTLLSMKLPIAMVWGNNIGPFIRPIQWICSIIDQTVIEWDIFGIKASNDSFGHRFLTQSNDFFSGQKIKINSTETYLKQLYDAKVMVIIEDRQSHIKKELNKMDGDIDVGLLHEVTHLVEWPEVLKISFSNEFLNLPKEVLSECLKKHQKAFMVKAVDGYKNECLVVADSVTKSNRSKIINGNQRVMLARLNDVQFFWDEDLKNNGFSNWNQTLSGIIFQQGLGSLSDKVERVSHIAHTIMDQLNLTKPEREIVYRAAKRAKADLASQMVNELPNLQGIMGAYYAMYFKEDAEVVLAIRDQYKPTFEGDDYPETLPGVILSLADRIDTMVACYENNAIPTGSRDPWGIRRSMIAIIRMIIHFKIDINLELLLEDATLTLEKKIGENTQKCRNFFITRVETVFQENNIPADMIQLNLKRLLMAPLKAYESALALVSLKQKNPGSYNLLLETTTRVAKIITNYDGDALISNQLFEHDIESEAYDSFIGLRNKRNKFSVAADDMSETLTFCQTLSTYFEKVLINAEDPDTANNRRSFIKHVNDYFLTGGNWLKLQK